MSKELIGSFKIDIEIAKDGRVNIEASADGDAISTVDAAVMTIIDMFAIMDKQTESSNPSSALIHGLAEEFGYMVKKK